MFTYSDSYLKSKFSLPFLVNSLKLEYSLSDYTVRRILSWDNVRYNCFLDSTTLCSLEDFVFLCLLNDIDLELGLNESWLEEKKMHLEYLIGEFNYEDDYSTADSLVTLLNHLSDL